MRRKISVGSKALLVKDLLFVEGITRSGKFLLANILAGFKGVEPAQNPVLVQKIPIFAKFGLIDRKTAEEFLKHEIDIYCYEMYIGRNLNHRLSDKSSIFNHPRHKEFLKRCLAPEGDVAVAKFYKERPYSSFIMHETMPFIDIYFNIFPKLKVVHIQRSPMDLVFSWYKRGYGRRLKNDPRFWAIPFEEGGKLFPWYVHPNQKEYFNLSEMDRVIFSIISLLRLYKKGFSALPAKNKKKILSVRYEEIIREPRNVINKIAAFLRRKPSPQMPAILKRERLPNRAYFDSKDEKIAEIKKFASPKYFRSLLKLQKEYSNIQKI